MRFPSSFAWSVLGRYVLVLGFALAMTACSGTGATRTASSETASESTAPERTAEATSNEATSDEASSDEEKSQLESQLESLYWERQKEAWSNYSKADVRFMRMMISHHAQALVMSDMADRNGASEQVQTLAARIMNAQRDEIATMQRWLQRRDQPVPEVEIDGTDLRVNGMTVHGMDMVGVLTQAQIDELDAARGTEFDRLFLTYMIEHHRGAVSMVDTLFSTDGAAQDEAAFKLASEINVDQKTEIARMRQMLRALPDAPSDS